MTVLPYAFLLLLLLLPNPARSTCPESDQIHCGTSDRCTRIRYICDSDNDCGDNTDEASDLCAVWRNSDCERNSARCTRFGRSDCVTISNYCSLDNPPCEGSLDPRVCVMLKNGKIATISSLALPTTTTVTTTPITTPMPLHMIEELYMENFEHMLGHTISHPDCPQLYTLVGDLCLSVFFIGNMTWLESRAFCTAIGGDLFTFGENITPYVTLLKHLRENSVTADFWVGGRYVNETVGWAWSDNTPIPMGSPLWAVRHQNECSTRSVPYINSADTTNITNTRPANDATCYSYQQAPPTFTSRHCLAATYEHYYYLSDQDCFSKRSPLCAIPGKQKKQAL